MKKRLTHIAPLKTGIVLSILYGIGGLIAAPLVLLGAVFGSKTSGMPGAGGVIFAIAIPVLYAAIGFIGGLIAAALYNLVAKWTGGLEFEVTDIPTV